MTLTKLNGNESGVIIAKLINALIDEKASIDLSDLDATGEQRFTDLNTAISTLNTALSTLTTTVNKKVEATVSLAANGYIKFDNGLIIAWAHYTNNNDTINSEASINKTINLPIAINNRYYISGQTGKVRIIISVNGDTSTTVTYNCYNPYKNTSTGLYIHTLVIGY